MQRRLRGMTWDHSRGYDPLAGTSAEYARRHPGVEIAWERRSLQAFADFPVEQLADAYDLVVIDHPHVGFVADAGCFVALDTAERDVEMKELAKQTLGPSHATYGWAGHQWALAIDAATQVASYRPDLIDRPPASWHDVATLARAGKVLWPVKPVDALMGFFTLLANRGSPCRTDGDEPLFDRRAAFEVLGLLRDVAQHIPRECLAMNPIEVYERLADPANASFAYCPLGYGYTNYARNGYRPRLLRFADIPEASRGAGPRGSCIGGTGIAVSARSKNVETAVDYAFWIASADCQRTLYFDAGGQPGNAVAWEDDHCNAAAHGFFRDTRRTLDGVYVRPRYDGYLGFQDAGGTIVNRFLAGDTDANGCLDELNDAYRASLQSAHR